MIKVLMICHSGKKTGLGHLSRTVSISKMLKKKFNANIKTFILGESQIKIYLN